MLSAQDTLLFFSSLLPSTVTDTLLDTCTPAAAVDFPSPRHDPAMTSRTLIIAPPSVAAHPEKLNSIYEIHDRSLTDLQMLDRIAAGLANLPSSTYDVVLLLTDAEGTSRESHALLVRDVMHKIVGALKFGGVFKSQDGALQGSEKTEAILAGLVESPQGMTKPVQEEPVSIPLKFGRKKAANGTNGTNGVNGTSTNGAVQEVNADGSVPLNLNRINLNGKRPSPEPVPAKPSGVGFVDFSDDLDDPIITGGDDDLIDEDDLITEEDMARPVIQRTYPPHSNPYIQTNLYIQPSNAVPSPASAAAPARTAPAV